MLKLIKHIVINTALLTFVLTSFPFFSTAQNSEETALQFFKDGNYVDALPFYQQLNDLYPNDHIIQYNYGVCLTESNNFGNLARKLLLQASQNDVPSKVFFYIAKNYHALNDFETANIYYIRFDNYAKNRDKRALDFYQIWEKCKLNINPFIPDDNKSVESQKKSPENFEKKNIKPKALDNTHESTNSMVLKNDSIYLLQQINDTVNIVDTTIVKESEAGITKEQKDIIIDAKEPLEIPTELMDTTFNFILNSKIYYQQINQFKTTEGQTLFIEAWNSSEKLKLILVNIDFLRDKYKQSNSQTEKASISDKVLALEMETIQLKSKSDKNFLNARTAEIEYWNKAATDEISSLMNENDSIKQSKRKVKEILIKEEEILTPDSINTFTDTSNNTKNPVIEQLNTIIYKVQIGAYSKGLPEYIDRLYKKLAVLRKIDNYTDDKGIVVYTIGELTNYENAIKLQNQIRQEGVKDAFVVAYNKGKRITLKEAKEITNNE